MGQRAWAHYLAGMHPARRTHGFRESVIRGMTRLAREHNAINLAQGFPNFPAPELLKEAAAEAIRDDINQYAITWGAQRLRDALARKYRNGMAYGRPRAGDHGHLRRHRGDDRHTARGRESGRRGDRVRAVLRELRPRRDPLRRPPGVRAARSPASRSISTGSPPPFRRAPAPSSSTRRAIPPAGCSRARARGDPRSLRAARLPRGHGRDLRAHPSTRARTSRSPRCRACASARSRSAAPRRRSA